MFPQRCHVSIRKFGGNVLWSNSLVNYEVYIIVHIAPIVKNPVKFRLIQYYQKVFDSMGASFSSGLEVSREWNWSLRKILLAAE